MVLSVPVNREATTHCVCLLGSSGFGKAVMVGCCELGTNMYLPVVQELRLPSLAGHTLTLQKGTVLLVWCVRCDPWRFVACVVCIFVAGFDSHLWGVYVHSFRNFLSDLKYKHYFENMYLNFVNCVGIGCLLQVKGNCCKGVIFLAICWIYWMSRNVPHARDLYGVCRLHLYSVADSITDKVFGGTV